MAVERVSLRPCCGRGAFAREFRCCLHRGMPHDLVQQLTPLRIDSMAAVMPVAAQAHLRLRMLSSTRSLTLCEVQQPLNLTCPEANPRARHG